MYIDGTHKSVTNCSDVQGKEFFSFVIWAFVAGDVCPAFFFVGFYLKKINFVLELM